MQIRNAYFTDYLLGVEKVVRVRSKYSYAHRRRRTYFSVAAEDAPRGRFVAPGDVAFELRPFGAAGDTQLFNVGSGRCIEGGE